jgi:hypothetical protein
MLLDAIELPDDLVWEDEFSWSSVIQNLGYSATGSLFIQESTMQAGRPITLIGASDMAWINRETVESLYAKAAVAGTEMTLVLSDARSLTVMFKQDEDCIQVAPVKGYAGLETGAWYEINSLKLMEV